VKKNRGYGKKAKRAISFSTGWQPLEGKGGFVVYTATDKLRKSIRLHRCVGGFSVVALQHGEVSTTDLQALPGVEVSVSKVCHGAVSGSSTKLWV
jgi:hypothetical protein